jgi:hypothetical protein
MKSEGMMAGGLVGPHGGPGGTEETDVGPHGGPGGVAEELEVTEVEVVEED